MPRFDPGCVVRIAIALAVLKLRPRDQSFASYLLDLQSHFPVPAEHDESRGWRTYALELEKQLTVLKAQRDADQELLSKLPPDASQVSSTSDSPPPKKKSKKNPTKDQHDPEWSWDQNRADWSRVLVSQYPSSPSLVVAYGSLKGAIAAPNIDTIAYASRLADAILRALHTIHLFLFSPPSSNTDTQTFAAPLPLRPEHIDSTRIALASPLLVYLLRTALHVLIRAVWDSAKSKRPHTVILASTDTYVQVDKVLDRLFECILLPLLQAITPLSSARLARLIPVPLKKDTSKAGRATGSRKDKDKDKRSVALVDPLTQMDVRTDVFAFIGTSLEALDTLPALVRSSGPGGAGGGSGSIAGDVRVRLGLETISELEVLYANLPSAPLVSPSSLRPSPPQPIVMPSETQPPLSTPDRPLFSAPSLHRSQAQVQHRTQRRTAPESRAKRLERLVGTRAERVRALAMRDAGWFLASTLNLCVTSTPAVPTTVAARHGPPHAGTDTSGELLRKALLDRIGKLVQSVHLPLGVPVSDGTDLRGDRNAKVTIDPVCRNMLLAVCERAVSHLAL